MSVEKHLTAELVARLISYDPKTGALTWLPRENDQRHTTRWAGKPALAAVKQDGRMHGAIMGHTAIAHRVAWAIYYGRWPDGVIDHINGDPSDNRIENLRVCSQHENSMNRRKKVGKTSKYYGVNYSKRHNRYYAFVNLKHKTHYAGSFLNEKDAAVARDNKALELHGAYAVLNFPEQVKEA